MSKAAALECWASTVDTCMSGISGGRAYTICEDQQWPYIYVSNQWWLSMYVWGSMVATNVCWGLTVTTHVSSSTVVANIMF